MVRSASKTPPNIAVGNFDTLFKERKWTKPPLWRRFLASTLPKVTFGRKSCARYNRADLLSDNQSKHFVAETYDFIPNRILTPVRDQVGKRATKRQPVVAAEVSRIADDWWYLEGHGDIIRGDILTALPTEVLNWRIDHFGREFGRYDNFALLLGAWVEHNVRLESFAQGSNAQSYYWEAQRSFRRDIYISLFNTWDGFGSLELGSRTVPRVAYTLAGNSFGIPQGTVREAFGRAIQSLAYFFSSSETVAPSKFKRYFRSVSLAIMLTASAIGLAYQVYRSVSLLKQQAVEAPLKRLHDELSRMPNHKLFQILEDQTTNAHQTKRMAALILAGRAKREGAVVYADGGGSLPPNQFFTKYVFKKPVFVRPDSSLFKVILGLDQWTLSPAAKQALKETDYVLFTPRVITKRRGVSYRISGAYFGDRLVAISCMDLSGRVRSQLEMIVALRHETSHLNRHQHGAKISRLKDETISFGAGEKESLSLQPQVKAAGLRQAMQDVECLKKVNQDRKEVGIYLQKFNSDFLDVYPERIILSRSLLEARLSIRTLLRYREVETDALAHDQQLQVAVKVALLVMLDGRKLEGASQPLKAEEELEKLLETGSSLEKINAEHALAYLRGEEMSSSQRERMDASDWRVFYSDKKKKTNQGQNQRVEVTLVEPARAGRDVHPAEREKRQKLIGIIRSRVSEIRKYLGGLAGDQRLFLRIKKGTIVVFQEKRDEQGRLVEDVLMNSNNHILRQIIEEGRSIPDPQSDLERGDRACFSMDDVGEIGRRPDHINRDFTVWF